FPVLLTKMGHPAVEDTQAVDAVVFLTVIQQRLHAHTNTEQRFARVNHIENGPVQPGLGDHPDTVTNGTDTGKHHPVRMANLVRVTGNHDALTGSHFLQRLAGGVQIPHAVIDHGDGFTHTWVPHSVSVKVPLVLGVMSPMRGSLSTATRSARPKALNTVSAWW